MGPSNELDLSKPVSVVPFADLSTADLVVDAVYEGEPGGQLSGEALSRLLPGVGNQGGFRASGRGADKRFVALYTSGDDQDWPDSLDISTGQLVYYGDNKRPGYDLHATQRSGNRILRHVFDLLHSSAPQRHRIPPFLVFRRHPTPASARSFQFKGVAAPGFPGLPATSDLVAVWKATNGQRFQNYRAVFTILDIPSVKRAWLNELVLREADSDRAPDAWRQWTRRGRYLPLTAESTATIRSQLDQTPDTPTKLAIVEMVWRHFRDVPTAFESFAARIFQMHDPRVIIDQITRASVDGGRDAVGRYLLGLNEDPVYAEFSLEAKCYAPPGVSGLAANAVGVKEVSRLISRIRHRQFGVLVTTSTIGRQAYEEVRGDHHPIIFISARDIANILAANGYGSPDHVAELLHNEFGH